ncbi:hypothetical protein DRQ07_11650 [candidate division KSB1 bacterium]|nr:MAG: hypothetical protein DRQ07_11650 [candidate division KSB1 bacterium]
MFRFAFKYMLYLLFLIPLMIGLFAYAAKKRKRALSVFGSPDLVQKLTDSVNTRARAWKRVIFIAALFFLILGLARPQYGTKLKMVKREGQDIVIALDVSLSMTAEDITPNRLEKAKHEIASIIDMLKGDRVGLIAFSGRAFVQCPLALDYSAVKMFLNAVDPGIIPVPGTAIAEAINKAVTCFDEKERKHKVLILITDGEDHEGKPVEAAKEAAKQGVVIYTVGLGSRQGVPIPVYDENGNRKGFKKDKNGQVVMTKLDEASLQKIALETGGKYYRGTPGEVELSKIYRDILKMEKKSLASKQYTQFEDRFQLFVFTALFLLIIEFVLPERRKAKGEWKGRF